MNEYVYVVYYCNFIDGLFHNNRFIRAICKDLDAVEKVILGDGELENEKMNKAKRMLANGAISVCTEYANVSLERDCASWYQIDKVGLTES